MMERRQETKAVKKALLAAGIPAKVKYGTGTARSWIDIYPESMPTGEAWMKRHREIIDIAQRVTGRYGEYDGRIIVC